MSAQPEHARKKAAQEGPCGHEKTTSYGEVPDCREIDEEARIRRQSSQESSNQQLSHWIIRIVMFQPVSKKVGRHIDTNRVDGEQRPWNLMRPIG